jgi:hypothetical protein
MPTPEWIVFRTQNAFSHGLHPKRTYAAPTGTAWSGRIRNGRSGVCNGDNQTFSVQNRRWKAATIPPSPSDLTADEQPIGWALWTPGLSWRSRPR